MPIFKRSSLNQLHRPFEIFSTICMDSRALEPKPSVLALPGVNCRIYGHLQSWAFGGQWTGKWKFMSTSRKGSKKWRQARSARWVSCHTCWHSTAPLAHRDSPILLVKEKSWFKFSPKDFNPSVLQVFAMHDEVPTTQNWKRNNSKMAPKPWLPKH